MQKKFDVFILDTDLDNRKQLSSLLPLSRFVLKFYFSIEELSYECRQKIPHIVFINIDLKELNLLKNFRNINELLPSEVVVIGLSCQIQTKFAQELLKRRFYDIWELPISGLKCKNLLSMALNQIKPIKVNSIKEVSLLGHINGRIAAMGEAELIVEFPLKLNLGAKLHLESKLLDEVLDHDEKVLVVTENKNPKIVEHQVTVTILGLRNIDLKRIRAKILNWEKL